LGHRPYNSVRTNVLHCFGEGGGLLQSDTINVVFFRRFAIETASFHLYRGIVLLCGVVFVKEWVETWNKSNEGGRQRRL